MTFCGICGKHKNTHIGAARGCFGGYGTTWNPQGERDYRVWPKDRDESHPEWGGRPKGPTMPCGWCGDPHTSTSIRKHFTDCPKRPKNPR